MNENFVTNNRVYLVGEVTEKPTYSHELYGEGFYEFCLAVPRLSGQTDVLPITVSERLMADADLEVGSKIALVGQFRSYNKLENERSKLMLTVFVRDFMPPENVGQNPNIAELNGYVCKPPVYRTTPFNREICDLLLAVNRGYNKSDYIPCIAWGRNARFARSVAVGQNVSVSGRIQSRNYNKKLPDDTVEVRTAYELSVGKIMLDRAAEETAASFAEDLDGQPYDPTAYAQNPDTHTCDRADHSAAQSPNNHTCDRADHSADQDPDTHSCERESNSTLHSAIPTATPFDPSHI